MLGNRYFLARQFDKAIPCLEEALQRNPNGHKIKKKLVVCYIEVGQVERAFNYFHTLVHLDPHIIIDTDPYYDDCPCCELIPIWENKHEQGAGTVDVLKILGMLYLYCNVDKAIEFFNEVIQQVENPVKTNSILTQLTKVSV